MRCPTATAVRFYYDKLITYVLANNRLPIFIYCIFVCLFLRTCYNRIPRAFLTCGFFFQSRIRGNRSRRFVYWGRNFEADSFHFKFKFIKFFIKKIVLYQAKNQGKIKFVFFTNSSRAVRGKIICWIPFTNKKSFIFRNRE